MTLVPVRRFFAVLALCLGVAVFCPGSAPAVEPDEMLDDPALEERARVISARLRCLVCRNESIDESDADLARDLRLLVRERLLAGDGNDQVIAYARARYGDYVLLDPPFTPATLLLWVGPALLFLAGVWLGVARLRRRPATKTTTALSAAERRRVEALLHEADKNGRSGDAGNSNR